MSKVLSHSLGGDDTLRGHLAAIVACSEDAIISKDLRGIITSWNAGAERLYGYTAEEAVGRPIAMLVPEDQTDEIPAIMARLVRGERVEHYETIRQAKDGRRLTISLSVSPIKDASGRVLGASAVARDITDRKHSEQALQFLAEAGEVLAGSLDYEMTLRTVAELAVPRMADWCMVDIREAGGAVRRLATAHRDRDRRHLVEALTEQYPLRPDAAQGTAAVLHSGQTQWQADVPDELLTAIAQNAEHLRILRELALRSYIGVPLKARGRVLGAITLITAESGRRYTQQDARFAEDLARHAALAMDNARLHDQTQRDLARRKQAEHELRQSEARERARADELAALMDSVPAVVFLAHDPQGERITGSRYAYQMLRVPPGGNLSRSAPASERPEHFHVFQHGVELPGEQLPVQRAARGEYVRGEELEVRFDDGRVRHLFGDVIPVHDERGSVRGSLAAMIDITQHKATERQLHELTERLEQRVAERTAELQKRMAQLQRLTVDLTRAEQRERHRLARMLHDHHQQLLVAIKMQAEMLRQADVSTRPQKLEQIRRMMDEAIESSRSLSYELSPQALYSEGLAAALRWLARQQEAKYNLSLHVDADPTAEPASEDAKMLLYELARELLLNVVKHAQTDQAWIRTRLGEPDHVELRVEDRGRGFDLGKWQGKSASSGLGLTGMHERLAALGGELEVQSQPGHGTLVSIRIPRDAALAGRSTG